MYNYCWLCLIKLLLVVFDLSYVLFVFDTYVYLFEQVHGGLGRRQTSRSTCRTVVALLCWVLRYQLKVGGCQREQESEGGDAEKQGDYRFNTRETKGQKAKGNSSCGRNNVH